VRVTRSGSQTTVVPLRAQSWVIVRQRPFFIDKYGCVRFRASEPAASRRPTHDPPS